MYIAEYKKAFQKDVKRVKKLGKAIDKLKKVIRDLLDGNPLDQRFRDHALKGEYADCRECHIEPDWLLIYIIMGKKIIFVRTGSHSDLFK